MSGVIALACCDDDCVDDSVSCSVDVSEDLTDICIPVTKIIFTLIKSVS